MTKRNIHGGADEHDITDALRNKAGEVREDLSEMASLAVDAGRDQLGKIRDSTVKNLDDAKEQLATFEAALKSYVCQRPVKSLLIAAGIGMVMSMLLRRR